jgi:hypothetical protein
MVYHSEMLFGYAAWECSLIRRSRIVLCRIRTTVRSATVAWRGVDGAGCVAGDCEYLAGDELAAGWAVPATVLALSAISRLN